MTTVGHGVAEGGGRKPAAGPPPRLLRLGRAGALACLALAAVFSRGAVAQAPDAARPRANGRDALRIHDPSTIVKDQGEYWLFSTGNGICSFRSTNLADWKAGPPVFAAPPAWTREVVPGFRGYFWAPDVIRVGRRFLLYYSVSTWGKNTSAIGLASNPTLDPAAPDFKWTDHGLVLRSWPSNQFNAIDPAAFQDSDGTLWMAFGSFWSGIQLIQLDPATGLRLAHDEGVRPLAFHSSIEAPFLHRRGDAYYLFVNWGQCCRGTNSTYEIRVGRSRTLGGPYVDRQGAPLLENGGSLVLATSGTRVGPGHAGIVTEQGVQRLSFHYYDAARRGAPTLGLRRLDWDAEGWPVVAP